VALDSDVEVMRYIGTGVTQTRAEAWRSMASFLGHWQLRGYGMWAVERRDTRELVGRVGFINPEGWPGFELGWMLRRASWGRGYATEAARRLLDHAFTDMKRERVISLIRAANAPSIRVAERLGERLDGRAEIFGQDALVYAIDRAGWRAQKS